MRYAQTQNDNLRDEYAALLALGHAPGDVAWARVGLGAARGPEAVNLWIGNSRSVTALHRDNYENVYVQVAGRKHFVLLPPACHACVAEERLPPARYVRRRRPAAPGRLELVVEDGEEPVPFPTWDPDRPAERATPYSPLACPMRVTLEPGDMLYLPCMWCVAGPLVPFFSFSFSFFFLMAWCVVRGM